MNMCRCAVCACIRTMFFRIKKLMWVQFQFQKIRQQKYLHHLYGLFITSINLTTKGLMSSYRNRACITFDSNTPG
ncbi:hypothetical protein XELAEV_18003899mg [Xenopus laevis]|uniref:Uncharacterized protein n=1 Tax=Xenopus laevis TaxID=8355 RepID=A0A974H011_XENLA|nr:hypothetical protein XELAEV_18003899mg [Xenopus laevis]